VLLDAWVIYCGDCLEQLKKLPDRCVDPSIRQDSTAVDRHKDARMGISLHSHVGIV
jgi:hypothetical protein